MKKISLLLFVSFFATFLQGQDTIKPFICFPQMPEYPEGQKALFEFLNTNIKYPLTAIQNSLQGKVFIGFMVEIDGTLTDIKVKRGIVDCPECDEEAIRVVKLMPKWKPAIRGGETFKIAYTLPIQFKLE